MTGASFSDSILVKVLNEHVAKTVYTKSIYLVNIMTTEHGVKQRVEVIQQVDHLDGVTEGGDGGETHDVTEVDGHLVKILWLHGATSLESLRHRSEADGECHASNPAEYRLLIACVNSRRKHLRQQFLCSLLLHLQLFGSLSDQVFQIRAVLLQHPQHGVDDVGLLTLIDQLKLPRNTCTCYITCRMFLICGSIIPKMIQVCLINAAFQTWVPCQRSHQRWVCAQAVHSSTASSAGYTLMEPGLEPRWAGTSEEASSPYGWSLRETATFVAAASFALSFKNTSESLMIPLTLTICRKSQHAIRWPSDHNLLKDNRKTVHVSFRSAFTCACDVT